MKRVICVAVLAAAVVVGGRLVAQEKGKAKYPIKTIMEKAHKGGQSSLRNKVVSGKASKEDLNMLVELYEELGKNTPPKGDKAAWKKKTEAVLEAARKVKAEPTDQVARQTLAKVTTCMACHDVFREEE